MDDPMRYGACTVSTPGALLEERLMTPPALSTPPTPPIAPNPLQWFCNPCLEGKGVGRVGVGARELLSTCIDCGLQDDCLEFALPTAF